MKYNFKDLVDVPRLQELTDELYRATAIPSAIITMDGEILTGSGWQRICTHFHRQHPEIEKDCIDSDIKIRDKMEQGEPFTMYQCPRGLVDASSPVVIEGEHVANVFAGQLFTTPPGPETERFFRETARRYGFDEAEYMAAYWEIPVFPEERFRPALTFLARFAELVATIGLTRLRELEAVERVMTDERRHRRLLESTRAVPWELDLATKRFTYMGPQAESVLSYPPEYWKDFDIWAKTIHDHDREQVINFCLKETEAGRDHDFEYRIIARDGREIWVQDMVTVLSGPSGPERLVGFMRDITERKQAEQEKTRLSQQLAQSQKMELIGRLAGGIAHDFNNLLTGIIGHISLAAMDLDPSEPLYETMTEIGKAADRAAGLTRKLLGFARNQMIEPEIVNLNDLIQDSLSMISRLIGEDVKLTTRPGPGLGSVLVDPRQVEQILINLAVNARDAMPEGGTLSIEAADVEPNSAAPYVRLSVSDTGHGMDDEVRARVFEPFFTTKPAGQGTGLGLAMVQGAVEQSGGRVEVFSEVGVGTRFDLYFPRAKAPATPRVLEEIPRTLPRGDETVLLAEDEPIVRHLAVKVLEQAGYRVLVAENGREALGLARRHRQPIHLLLTDVVMPLINGKELADELVKFHPETRVLFTSGYTGTIIARHGVIDEGLNFIAKPYTPQDLAAKVRAVLDRPG